MLQKNVIFVTVGTLKILVLNMNHIFHDLMVKTMNFNDAAIVSVKASNYRTYFWHMSQYDVISIIKNSDLKEKNGLF